MRAAENSIKSVLPDKQIYFLFLPDGEDPDTFVEKKGKNEFLNFPDKYLYHPGQYSSHKNQRILIDAIDQLKKRNFNDFGVVFSGTDRGNLKFLKKLELDLLQTMNLEI